MASITVQVSKTVQVKQYEPVVVTVTETRECRVVDAEQTRDDMYRAVTQSVRKYIDNEQRKYGDQKRRTTTDEDA